VRHWAWAGLVLLAVAGGTARADGVATIRTMGGLGVGARALGVGGAFTAVADGPQALYWNPAALAAETRLKTDASITGRVQNADVLVDLGGIYDAVKDENLTASGFNDLWDAAGKASGRPVQGEVGSLFGLSYGHFAIGGYGQAAGNLLLLREEGGVQADAMSAAQFDPTQDAAITGSGSGLAYYAVAVGYGRMVTRDLAVGAAIKRVHVVRAAAQVSAQYDAGSYTYSSQNQTATSAGDDAYAADLGLIWWPQAEKYDRRVRLAAVVRNLGSPRFDVALPTDTLTRLTFEPTVNLGLGVTSTDGRTLFTADVHNVLGSNDAIGAVAAGVEHQLTSWLALRAGLRQGQFTTGLTLQAGPVALTAAGGTPWGETAAFSFNTQF